MQIATAKDKFSKVENDLLSIVDKFRIIVEMQDSLNRKTVGDNWEEKELAFNRAVYMEAAEAMEETNYKWWKHTPTDWDNLFVEAIDILHFTLSDMIEKYSIPITVEMVSKIYFERLDGIDEDELKELYSLDDSTTMRLIVEQLETLMLYGLEKKTHTKACQNDLADLFLLLRTNTDSIFRAYMIKNTLNEFRIKNGYQDGTYVKMWDGIEDNVMATALGAGIDVTENFKKNLLDQLTLKYEELTKE